LLVLLLVAMFHVAGAWLAERFPALSTAMHGVGTIALGVGTIALGAGIFLSGQIFNLQEHWPGGIMLWAIGAWLAWWLLRDWVQAGLAAVLTPAWLTAEWIDATEGYGYGDRITAAALLLLALTYLTSRYADHKSLTRKVLAWIGGIAVIPFAIVAVEEGWYGKLDLPAWLLVIGYGVGFGLPLLLALWLRGRAAWMNAVAAAWILVLHLLPKGVVEHESAMRHSVRMISPYAWGAIASIGLIAWGLKEARQERVNLGILGFGITVLAFYFSEVMDKLGRSFSLIGLGMVFLVLAWGLERARRRLIAQMREAGS
jgi:uncharacterized membrane protein